MKLMTEKTAKVSFSLYAQEDRRRHLAGHLTSIFCIFVALCLVLPSCSVACTSSHGKASSPAGFSVPLSDGPRGPGPVAAPVDPFKHYKSEPAPMGICDFGVDGSTGRFYDYKTPVFVGELNITSLNCYNSGLGSYAYWITIQLNVVLVIYVGGAQYDYWVQNVAYFESNTNKMSWENNIWNMSSKATHMLTNTLTGSGSIQTYNATAEAYMCGAGALPGNNVPVTLPCDTKFILTASYDGTHPRVAFAYDNGFGMQTYDNVTFIFADGVDNASFNVWGSRYNLYGLYCDAELVLGGPGGGSHQTIQACTDLKFSIQYWNGHNYQYITNAYNFGSNTAEAVNGVLENGFSSSADGSLYTVATGGAGTLMESYGFDQVGLVNISAPSVPGGILYVNGTAHSFTGNDVNLTLAPGFYNLLVNSPGYLTWETNITLDPGEYRFLVAGNSAPEFAPLIAVAAIALIVIPLIYVARRRTKL